MTFQGVWVRLCLLAAELPCRIHGSFYTLGPDFLGVVRNGCMAGVVFWVSAKELRLVTIILKP